MLYLFQYAYFTLFVINKNRHWNTVSNVGIKPGSFAWKSNAKLFSELATRYLLVHIAIAMCYSSSKLFTNIKVKQNFSQQLRWQKCFIIWVLVQHPLMWNKLFYLLHSRRHGLTWLNSRWWLAACGCLMYALSILNIVTKIAKKNVWG